MKKSKNLLYIIVGLVAGSLLTLATSVVLAHNGDINLIHACYRTNTGGNFRIVGPNEDCNPNTETALDWNIQGIQGPPGPTGVPGQNENSDFVCANCEAKDILHRINEPDLTNVNFNNAMIPGVDFRNTDISESTFVYAVARGDFNGANATNTDFTNANLLSSSMQESANFTGAKFVNANMSYGSYNGSTFINADFTNTNLSNAFLNDSNVTGANFTGTIWHYTYCPDGTNSDDNGNTCEGHLTP